MPVSTLNFLDADPELNENKIREMRSGSVPTASPDGPFAGI